MTKNTYTRIIGTGSYLPTKVIENKDFLNHTFYDVAKTKIDKDINEIVDKFEEITNISQRLHAEPEILTSDMAAIAVERACEDANVSLEDLDFVIVSHNFGDVQHQNKRIDGQ